MQNCLQDGRWHLVYSNDASGNNTFGDISVLESAIQDSADVRVSSPSAPYTTSSTTPVYWTCTVIQPNADGSITCWDSVRLAGVIQANPYLGAAALSTTGQMICVGIHPGTPSGSTIISNDNGMCPKAAFNWSIRY